METLPRPAKAGITGALSACAVSRQQNHIRVRLSHSPRKRKHLILQENNVHVKNRTLTIFNYLQVKQ